MRSEPQQIEADTGERSGLSNQRLLAVGGSWLTQLADVGLMADAQRVSAVDVDHLPFVTLLYARRLPSSIEGMDMKDQMRAAFEAWATSEASPIPAGMSWDSDMVEGYWQCWQAATAHNASATDEKLRRLRESLVRLLAIDEQLRDLLGG